MDKKELEKKVIDMEIDRRVKKEVKYHCLAFWSVTASIIAWFGSIVSDNSIAFNAALKEFIRVWMDKQ